MKDNNMIIYSKKVIEKYGFNYIERKNENEESFSYSQYYIMGLGGIHSIFGGHFTITGLFSLISFFSMRDVVTNGLNILMNVVLPFVIVLIYFIKNKLLYKKILPNPKEIDIYHRDLPSKLKPAHVRMMLTDGMIDTITIVATLYDLIDNNYIDILSKDKISFFEKKEVILKKTNKSTNSLFKYEQFLIEWFIDICGDGEQISNLQLQEILKYKIDIYNPSDLFEYFQSLVRISFPINNYYKSSKANEKLANPLLVVASLWLAIYSPIFLAYYIGKFCYSYPAYILNQKGVDEVQAWLNLEKYLNDFWNIKDKSLTAIEIWEYYLTYSIALGINTDASEKIESFFGEAVYNNSNDTLMDERRLNKLKDCNNKINIEKIEEDIVNEMAKYKKIL